MNDMSTEGYTTADGRKIGGTLMEMKNITLSFGGVKAITDISFDIKEGEIRAIIGPNGAGKSRCSTLYRASISRSREKFGIRVQSVHRCGLMKSPVRALLGHFRTSLCLTV